MKSNCNIVIIGGVAGGASAAARARRLSEDARITVIERGPFVSFANCGLPYHLSGVIPERNHLLVQTPETLSARFNLDVRVNTEAVAVDREAHTVTIRDVKSGQSDTIRYDKLILSPGAEAFRPPVPGIDLPGVFTLQTIPEMDAIIRHIREKKVRRAAVIGGGFIGIESAENLALRGIAVSVIEADRQIMPPLDPEMAEILHAHLVENKIDLRLEQKVSAISRSGETLTVSFAGGGSLDTDMILLAIGVRPRVTLAKEAGLAIGVTGGIVVNDGMQTSDPDIYAVGDAVEITNPLTGLPAAIALAGPANRQGRIAADRIFGRDSHYHGTMGTSICQVFRLSAGAVGLTEKALVKAGRPFLKSYTHAGNHAGYYPGSYPIAIKLLFEPETGKIFGAQAVGADGVDKRIDVIATAIKAGMTVFDLEHLELSYAPPFGSAKDPVNMAGFVAANILRADHTVVFSEDLHDLDPASAFLLDVRTKGEFADGHIPGSMNIPVNELRRRLGELPKEKKIIAYCQVGLRGYVAQRMLSLSGFDSVNLSGGYKNWLMTHRLLSGIGARPIAEIFCNAPSTD